MIGISLNSTLSVSCDAYASVFFLKKKNLAVTQTAEITFDKNRKKIGQKTICFIIKNYLTVNARRLLKMREPSQI